MLLIKFGAQRQNGRTPMDKFVELTAVSKHFDTKKGRFLEGTVSSPPWHQHGRSIEHIAEGDMRGRLLLFPHRCPHLAAACVDVPKILLRGEVY